MMKAIAIKTEHLINPIGIDVQRPNIFWNASGGITQTAYEIAFDIAGKTTSTGKIASSSMHHRLDFALPPRTTVRFKIRLWDENNQMGEWSEDNSFEMGIGDNAINASWITGNYHVKKSLRYPVSCFKKEFTSQNTVKARLYISACGLYEAKINGKRVGNFILAPGITDYKKRIQYQTYDVTNLLTNGKNVITAELADGWFRGAVGAWGRKNQYGKVTALIACLELEGANGIKKHISTDESWSWSDDGAIRFADNKDGETVDGNLVPSYSSFAKKANGIKGVLTASNNVFVTEHERFKPNKIITPQGNVVLDFGQNIAGYIAFSLPGKKGNKISIKLGETLDSSGEFTQKNIQCTYKDYSTPLQKIEYTFHDGINDYKTKFAIFGFRYALIEGDIDIDPNDFCAIAVYSDLENTLEFDSSDELINKFVECTRWSLKNNSCDLPTDCPTRERHGWTGDAQIFAMTAGYFTNYAPFAKKYIADVKDAQKKNGAFTQIAPTGGVDFYMSFMDGSVGWADAGVLIPYRMWKLYGDKSFLTDNYTAMKKYAEFMIKRIGKPYPTAKFTGLSLHNRRNIVNSGQAYGEWAEPDDVHHMTWKDCAVPHPEVATAYTSYVLSVMAEIATALKQTGDAQRYAKISERTKNGYQALRETKLFSLDTDRQAELVRPLYFDLLKPKQTEYAKKRLIDALEHYGWRIGTGFLSTPLILFVLQNIDIEYAYRLLENKSKPGWLFMPANGATTIWEAWEGNSCENAGIASLDHYSKGAVCEWIFRSMCGINIVGENEFLLCPKAGGSLRHAYCTYQSIYGKIKCGWKKDGEKILYSVDIPANTKARFIVGNMEKILTAGKYEFAL